MDLPIALKSLLATLTTKTALANTDGVITITTSDGTPNGKISRDSLKQTLCQPIRQLTTSDNIDNLGVGWYGQANATSVGGSKPPMFSNGILANLPQFVGSDRLIQLYFEMNTLYIYYRRRMNNTWGNWVSFSYDIPDFYKSYANLAALATGIMGQTISSITAAYFQGTIAQAVFDNVFIAVTRLSDTSPLAVKPNDWSSYNSASAYHVDGVLLVSGDKHIVIATSEANLRWGADADSHAASGNTATSDRDAAMATFDGKARTNTAVQVSEYSSAEVAPGYCHAFTTVTSAYDTTKTAYARRKAGMWWLPSLGEMMMIWSNMTKINQVMSLIGGTPLGETYYWTSTETSQTSAWSLNLSYGGVLNNNKKNTHRVRPVAAF